MYIIPQVKLQYWAPLKFKTRAEWVHCRFNYTIKVSFQGNYHPFSDIHRNGKIKEYLERLKVLLVGGGALAGSNFILNIRNCSRETLAQHLRSIILIASPQF